MYPKPIIRIHLFFDFYKGVFVCCARKGGRGKHNTYFLGDVFRKAKYEIRRRRKKKRRKRRRAKIPSPPNPLPFCPPERKSFLLCRAKRGNQNSQSGFLLKKVRISSSKHHHIELDASLGTKRRAKQLINFGGVCWKKSELILNRIPIDCHASRGITKTGRSGGQKGRGLGGRNFCPPSLSPPPGFVPTKLARRPNTN